MLEKPPPPQQILHSDWTDIGGCHHFMRHTLVMSSLYAFWSWSVYANFPAVLTKNKARQVRSYISRFWHLMMASDDMSGTRKFWLKTKKALSTKQATDGIQSGFETKGRYDQKVQNRDIIGPIKMSSKVFERKKNKVLKITACIRS